MRQFFELSFTNQILKLSYKTMLGAIFYKTIVFFKKPFKHKKRQTLFKHDQVSYQRRYVLGTEKCLIKRGSDMPSRCLEKKAESVADLMEHPA